MARITPSDADINQPLIASPQRSQRAKALLRFLLVAMDVAMLFLGFTIGYLARLFLPFFPQPSAQPSFFNYASIFILQIVFIVVLLFFNRLYHQRRVFGRADQLRSIVGVVTIGVLLSNGLQELLFRNTALEVNYPRSMFFYVWFFSVLCVGVGRELHRIVQNMARRRGWACDNLLIIGSGKIARDMLQRIRSNPDLGYNIVGVVTPPNEHQGKMLGVPVLGGFAELADLIDAYKIGQVIIALPDANRTELVDLVTQCQRGQVDIKIYPDIFAYMAGDLNVDDVGGMPLLTVRDIALRGWKLSLKRLLDVFGSGMGLIFMSPLFLLTAYIIWRESKGPVFYTQIRMGLDGRPFPMIKFRSMRMDSEVQGPGWTTENDPRVTRVGRFMRKTNWDEIPQLINVLLGHMSLVGPRPERPVYVMSFREQIPRYMERHREKAGMTGWAQIHGLRGDTSIAERTAYDLWYVENWSLWLDIKIIIRTVVQTITRSSPNAY